MSDRNDKIDWEKWYPNKSKVLQNIRNEPLTNFKDTVFKDIENKNNLLENQNFYQRGYLKGEQIGYQKGFLAGKKQVLNTREKKGLSTYEKNRHHLKKELELFFHNFKNSLESIDSIVADRLFEIVVNILDQFINSDKILRNNQLFLSSIRQLITHELIFLKELQFQIHPKDKELIQIYFENFIKCYKWTFICHPKMLRGDCKIFSKQGTFNIKVSKYWKNLCQIIKVKSKQ